MLKIIKKATHWANLPLIKDTINRNVPFVIRKFYSESPHELNIAAITGGDEKVEHKLKVLQLEVEIWRQEGHLVPEDSMLTEHHWKELLKLESVSARRRYYEFLFKTEKKKLNQQLKKEQKRVEREQRLIVRPEIKTFEEFVQTYDLQHNNIFLRFYDSTINQMYNNRLIQMIQFGQKIVVDCGFDQNMTNRENINCAKQLMLLFAENRQHEEPFDLHYCNANPDSLLMNVLQRHIPQLYEKWFPLNVHRHSYLQQFPKDKLVYLTPHCREELLEYDHDAVYIIGAIVDKSNTEPLSLARAKEEGLKMAKLPLDRYLQWGSGSGKTLTLNQMVAILLDAKHTGDWKYALRHVPKRKLVNENDIQIDKNQFKPPRRSLWSPSVNRSNQFSANSDKIDKQAKINKERLLKVRSIMYD